MQALDKQIQERLQEINKENPGKEYVFVPHKYSPHFTLTFVAKDKKTVSESLKENDAAGTIQKKLEELANTTPPINMTENLNNATIDFWLGKDEAGYKPKGQETERKYKNYYNIVLKLTPNASLSALSGKTNDAFAVKPMFPFSAHATLGRVLEINDGDISAAIENLKSKFLGKKVSDILPNASKFGQFTIDSFSLKGEGAEEKEYKLTGNETREFPPVVF